jgi:UPF0271 protein
MQIDFNADLAEGFPHDEKLLQLVSSVNLACGAHAGNAELMSHSLRLAHQFRKRIGAHPGYFDREHFGRKEFAISPDTLFDVVLFQVAGLKALADHMGIRLSYLKPHGAMYHQVNRDQELAASIVRVAKLYNFAVVGLPDSILEKICLESEISYWREGFADRRYLPDRTLVPREQPDAIIHDVDEAVEQIDWLVHTLKVDTICIHSDHDHPDRLLEQVMQKMNSGKRA